MFEFFRVVGSYFGLIAGSVLYVLLTGWIGLNAVENLSNLLSGMKDTLKDICKETLKCCVNILLCVALVYVGFNL